jgi:hypothetical protein
MSPTEVLRGRIASLVRREGAAAAGGYALPGLGPQVTGDRVDMQGGQPVVLEFELHLQDGTQRLIKVIEPAGRPLREGQDVVVTGSHLDANGVLVADSVVPYAPPPAEPRLWPWILLSLPPLALAMVWVTTSSLRQRQVAAWLWVMAGVAVLLAAQARPLGMRLKAVLRTIGGAAFLAALLFQGRSGGRWIVMLHVMLMLLSVVAVITAAILFLVSRLKTTAKARGT